MELTTTQKMILSVLVSREKEIGKDREEFLSEQDWKTYNDNLDMITKFLEVEKLVI